MMSTTTTATTMAEYTTTPYTGEPYFNLDEGKTFGNICPEYEIDMIAILILIILILGVIGNMIVIYVLVVLREYQKSVTNVYVLQLAVSDLCFTFTLLLSNARGQRFKLSSINCKIVESARMISYYTSILFLAVMSLDRYLAVNHALSARAAKLRTNFSATVISLVIWIGCFIFDLPIIIYTTSVQCKCALKFPETSSDVVGSGDYEQQNETLYDDDDDPFRIYDGQSYEELEDMIQGLGIPTCMFGNTNLNIYVTINFVVFFILPLAVTVFCYISIIRKIRSMAVIGSNQSAALIKRKRVTNMVILMVSAFVVCWLPFHIHNLGKARGMFLSKKQCIVFKEVVSCLAFTNSVLNPLLYTFLGTNFRSRCTEIAGQFRRFSACLGSCGKRTKECAMVGGPCPNKTRTTQAQITSV